MNKFLALLFLPFLALGAIPEKQVGHQFTLDPALKSIYPGEGVVDLKLTELENVDVAGARDGNCMVYNLAQEMWLPGTCGSADSGGGASSFSELSGFLLLNQITNGLITEDKLSTSVQTKLNRTPTSAETGATIKTKLEALTGTNRLNATAIQGLPTIPTIPQNDFVDASISGNVLTLTRRDGTTEQLTLPQGGGGSGTESQDDFVDAIADRDGLSLVRRNGTTKSVPFLYIDQMIASLGVRTSAIELKMLDPIAVPASEDVKFAIATPVDGAVTDPAPSEYVKTKHIAELTRARLYLEVPSNLNFTDYIVSVDDGQKYYASSLHREVQKGVISEPKTLNSGLGRNIRNSGRHRGVGFRTDTSQGLPSGTPLDENILALTFEATDGRLEIYLKKGVRLTTFTYNNQSIDVPTSTTLTVVGTLYDTIYIPRASVPFFTSIFQGVNYEFSYVTASIPTIKSQFEIDGFAIPGGTTVTLQKKNPNQDHISHMTLGSEPLTQVRTIAQEEISKIPLPTGGGNSITPDERLKVSKLETYNRVNRIEIEDAHFSETSGTDAISKDVATSFTATKNGTLFIAIPSGEASEHPDLTIGVRGSISNRILAKKEVFQSSPEFWLYSHTVVAGATYDVRYDVNEPDLTLNRDVADLKREEAQLAQGLSKSDSRLTAVENKTRFQTVLEQDDVSYSFPDWFAGTFLKGGDATTTARATLENLVAKSHQTMMWTSIDPTNELNQRPHALLRYDTTDMIPPISIVRNFLGYRLNSANNKMEVFKSFFVPSGLATKKVRIADHTGKGAGAPYIVNLGTSPQTGTDTTYSYDRNLPQANETINFRVTAFLNGNNEGEQTFTLGPNATRGSPATLNYRTASNINVATITAFYEEGIIDVEVSNNSKSNLAVNGGHLSVDADYPRVSNVPAHLSEEVLWSTADLTSPINLAMLKYNDSDSLKGRWGLNINGATAVLEFSKASTTENPELLSTNPEVPGGIANVFVRELSTAVGQNDIDSRLDTVRQGADNQYANLRTTTEEHHTTTKFSSQVSGLDINGVETILGSVTHSHFGTSNILGTETGLVTGSTTIRVTQGAGQSLEHALRFKKNIPSRIHSSITYDEATGDITLPKGVWILCASHRLQNNTVGDNNNSRLFPSIEIKHGDNVRHANEAYVRWKSGDTGAAGLPTEVRSSATQASQSVTGIVVSNGVTKTKIVVGIEAQGRGGNVEILNGHLHIARLGS